MQVLQKLCQTVNHDDVIVIAICTQVYSTVAETNVASVVVDEHYQCERNPWRYTTVLNAIDAVVKEITIDNIIVSTLIPRPDIGLEQIKVYFPQNRIWVIPKCEEGFDDFKEKFYQQNGEVVLRIEDYSNVSGWNLRKAYFSKCHTEFYKDVPKCVADKYFNEPECN